MDISGSDLHLYCMEKNSEIMDKRDIIFDIWTLFLKNIGVIALIVLGLVGKFSYDLLTGKRFTMAYVFGSMGCAIVGGWVCGDYIMRYWPHQATLFIPIATMISFNLISGVMAIDYKALMQQEWRKAFDVLTRTKKD